MALDHPVELILDDCMKALLSIGDGSVDFILADLPYGVTNRGSEAGAWDVALPMDELFAEYWRVLKPNGVVAAFAQGMFTAEMMVSQKKHWRYNLIWDKCRSSGFLNANRMPLRRHEDICIFYRQLPDYHVQLEDLNGREESHAQGNGRHADTNRCYGHVKEMKGDGVAGKKFPGSILSFPRPHCTGNHPTEKSVDLCRWLIRSYTSAGDLVLDATMGSGTTLVAAVLEGRRGIGIEREKKYFDVARRRVDEALAEMGLDADDATTGNTDDLFLM